MLSSLQGLEEVEVSSFDFLRRGRKGRVVNATERIGEVILVEMDARQDDGDDDGARGKG